MFIPIYPRLAGNVPPPQEWKSWIQVKVTFCFWLMYSPRSEKVGHRSKWHFASGWCTPPQEWNSWIQVKVTFWFWLMYPPPNWNWTKHECYSKKSFQERSSSTFYQSNPPSIIIIWFYAWTGNWWISISNGYMDSNPTHQPSPAKKIKCSFWITFNFWWLVGLVNGLKPHPPPHSSQKNKMLIFGLHSTSGDQPGWSMDSNPIHHPAPAKKIKCSFLDYVQLLMISQAGQWTWTPSTTPLQPKK